MESHSIPLKIHMETIVFYGSYRRFPYEFSMELHNGHGIQQGIPWKFPHASVWIFHGTQRSPWYFIGFAWWSWYFHGIWTTSPEGFMGNCIHDIIPPGMGTIRYCWRRCRTPRRDVCESSPKRCKLSDCSSKLFFMLMCVMIFVDTITISKRDWCS